MTLLAGLDVGNATTELVLADRNGRELVPRWHGRRPTVGVKGSDESLRVAAGLLERAERELGRRCETIVMARLRAVRTFAVEVPRAPVRPAPVTRIDRGGATPAGAGVATGRHAALGELSEVPSEVDVVVSVPAGTDFEDAGRRLTEAIALGWRVTGVLVGGDDAVLISNRLPIDIPIVDEAAVGALEPGERVAIEIGGDGGPVRALSDPLALAAALGLASDQAVALSSFARSVADAHALAVVARPTRLTGADTTKRIWLLAEANGVRLRFDVAAETAAVRSLAPGSARELGLPHGNGVRERHAVDDVFLADLSRVDDGAWLRRGVAALDAIPLAALLADPPTGAAAIVEVLADRPVATVGAEAAAGALGALTTPAAPLDAGVCDLGGGTIDATFDGGSMIAAGAGELVTVSVASALGIPRGLAEYAKRQPAVRVETPHLVHHEDGARRFLEQPAPRASLGQLCVRSGGELLPFHDRLAPEEWRSLRLAIKREVLGANVERCLAALPSIPRMLLLAGGAACDDEAVRIVAERLRAAGTTVGRANVAGVFGPRYAVAYGVLYAQLRMT